MADKADNVDTNHNCDSEALTECSLFQPATMVR